MRYVVLAAREGHLIAMKMLMKAGADPHSANNNNSKRLHTTLTRVRAHRRLGMMKTNAEKGDCGYESPYNMCL